MSQPRSLTPIAHLHTMLEEDFKGDIVDDYVSFETTLIQKITESSRSVHDQELEAMTILEERKHRNLTAEVALAISSASIVLSLYSAFMSENPISIIVSLIIAAIAIAVIIMTINANKRNYKVISYYSFKLNCIKKIKPHGNEQTE